MVPIKSLWAMRGVGGMTRRIDATEAAANAIAGLVISVSAVHVAWPLFGWTVDAGQSVSVAAIFFWLSTIRAYAIRRIFRRIK